MPDLPVAAANVPWDAWGDILGKDPGRRGAAGLGQQAFPRGAAGPLALAAASLAQEARHVALVTGFAIRTEGGFVPETDGPPGTLELAAALVALGRRVTLVTDAVCAPGLRAAAEVWQLSALRWEIVPLEAVVPSPTDERDPLGRRTYPAAQAWAREFLARPERAELSHVVSVERVGPAHTIETIAESEAEADRPSRDQFLREVPAADWDRPHSMRGEPIDGATAAVHVLFDAIRAQRAAVTTIGIGDGGNEIGCGRLPWARWRNALGESAGRIACRVATDHLLLAGVSNWAALALALGTLGVAGRLPVAAAWGVETHARRLQRLVSEAGLVDGVTGRREPTVDGLPLETYLAPLARLRSAVGLPA